MVSFCDLGFRAESVNPHKCSNMRSRRTKREGAAAVEAAICLPLLVAIWLLTVETNQLISLKQQAQILSSMGATQVVSSLDDTELIEERLVAMAESMGLQDFEIRIQRVDDEIVQTEVAIDFSANSSTNSLLGTDSVTSSSYSFREDIGL